MSKIKVYPWSQVASDLAEASGIVYEDSAEEYLRQKPPNHKDDQDLDTYDESETNYSHDQVRLQEGMYIDLASKLAEDILAGKLSVHSANGRPTKGTPTFKQLGSFFLTEQEGNDWLKLRGYLEVWRPDYSETGSDAPVKETALQTTTASVVTDVSVKAGNKKTPKTLAFNAEVIRLMTVFWDTRTPGTEPTKGDLHTSVYNEMLRGKIRGHSGKINVRMVGDAAKPWKQPLVLPSFVPPAQTGEKRHRFKGDK